jgi:hypothetical protein
MALVIKVDCEEEDERRILVSVENSTLNEGRVYFHF